MSGVREAATEGWEGSGAQDLFGGVPEGEEQEEGVIVVVRERGFVPYSCPRVRA